MDNLGGGSDGEPVRRRYDSAVRPFEGIPGHHPDEE